MSKSCLFNDTYKNYCNYYRNYYSVIIMNTCYLISFTSTVIVIGFRFVLPVDAGELQIGSEDRNIVNVSSIATCFQEENVPVVYLGQAIRYHGPCNVNYFNLIRSVRMNKFAGRMILINRIRNQFEEE